MKTIADNIKALRKNYSLTQGQLGEIAGVTDKAVSTWENGVAVPRMAVARRISEHFGISLSEILEESDEAAKYDVDPKALAIAKTIEQNPSLKQALHALQKRPETIPVVQKIGMLTSDEIVMLNQLLSRFYSVRTKK